MVYITENINLKLFALLKPWLFLMFKLISSDPDKNRGSEWSSERSLSVSLLMMDALSDQPAPGGAGPMGEVCQGDGRPR